MASWKVRRRDSCTSSPHSPPSNKFAWISSKIGKSTQHASLAVMLPSAHVTRLVTAAIYVVRHECKKEGQGLTASSSGESNDGCKLSERHCAEEVEDQEVGEVGNERPLKPGFTRVANSSFYTPGIAGPPVRLQLCNVNCGHARETRVLRVVALCRAAGSCDQWAQGHSPLCRYPMGSPSSGRELNTQCNGQGRARAGYLGERE